MIHALYPDKFTIAEDLEGSSRIIDTAGFDSQWDEQFFHQIYRTIATAADINRDMFSLGMMIERTFSGTAIDRIIYIGLW